MTASSARLLLAALLVLPALAPFAAAAPTTFTINVVSARSLGCSPDMFTDADLRVRVLVNGGVVATTEKAQDREEPLYGLVVQASAQLPATIGIEVEEAEPAGFFGSSTSWVACSLAPGGATRATFTYAGEPTLAQTLRGDGEKAAEATVVVGTSPPATPTLTASEVGADSLRLEWTADATGQASAHRVALGSYGAVLGSASGSAAYLTGLCDNKEYRYRVIRDAGAWHVASGDVTVKTANIAPIAATVLSARRDGNVSFESPTTHDIQRFEIHASGDAAFTPTDATLRYTIAGHVAHARVHQSEVQFRASDTHVIVRSVDTGGLSSTSASFALDAADRGGSLSFAASCPSGTVSSTAQAPPMTPQPEPAWQPPPSPTPTPYEEPTPPFPSEGPRKGIDDSGVYHYFDVFALIEAFEVRPKASVNITAGEPLNVTPGETATFDVLLLNRGDIALDVSAEPVFVVRHDVDLEMPVPEPSWTGSLSRSALRLDAYGKTTLTFRFTAPANASVGDLLVVTQVLNVTDGFVGGQIAGFQVPVRVVEAQSAATVDVGAGASLSSALVVGGVGAVGAGAVGFALWARRDAARFAMAAALYSRLAKSQILDHPDRERLVELIRATPGVCYTDLKRETGMNTGALVHHLRALERTGHVTSRKEGAFRRFYLAGAAPVATVITRAGPRLTPAQQRVVDALRAQPLTQGELAASLGLSQQGVNHHVKALERAGHIEPVYDGEAWRYQVVERFEIIP